MGEALYLTARVLMWLCFLALPFSPFLLMIEDRVLRFSLFGSTIGLELLLLFTGCSLKIYNHWREQKLEKILESEGYSPRSSSRSSLQAENSGEHGQPRRRSNSNTPLEPGASSSKDNGDVPSETKVRTPSVRFEKEVHIERSSSQAIA